MDVETLQDERVSDVTRGAAAGSSSPSRGPTKRRTPERGGGGAGTSAPAGDEPPKRTRREGGGRAAAAAAAAGAGAGAEAEEGKSADHPVSGRVVVPHDITTLLRPKSLMDGVPIPFDPTLQAHVVPLPRGIEFSSEGLDLFFNHMRGVARFFSLYELYFLEECPIFIPLAIKAFLKQGRETFILKQHDDLIKFFHPLAGGLLAKRFICKCEEDLAIYTLMAKRMASCLHHKFSATSADKLKIVEAYQNPKALEALEDVLGRASTKLCSMCRVKLVLDLMSSREGQQQLLDQELSDFDVPAHVMRFLQALRLTRPEVLLYDNFKSWGCCGRTPAVIKLIQEGRERTTEKMASMGIDVSGASLMHLDVLFALAFKLTFDHEGKASTLWEREEARALMVEFLDHGVGTLYRIPWNLVPDDRLSKYLRVSGYMPGMQVAQLYPRILEAGGDLPPSTFERTMFCETVWRLLQASPHPEHRKQYLTRFLQGMKSFRASSMDRVRRYLMKDSSMKQIDRERMNITFEAWSDLESDSGRIPKHHPALVKILLPFFKLGDLFDFLMTSWEGVPAETIRLVAEFANAYDPGFFKMTQSEVKTVLEEARAIFEDKRAMRDVVRNTEKSLVRCVFAIRNSGWAAAAKMNLCNKLRFAAVRRLRPESTSRSDEYVKLLSEQPPVSTYL